VLGVGVARRGEQARTLRLPADPALPARDRPEGLQTHPDAALGARIVDGAIVWERVADGEPVARHPAPGATLLGLLPGDAARVVVQHDERVEVVDRHGTVGPTLDGAAHHTFADASVIGDWLVVEPHGSVPPWNLIDGAQRTIPPETQAWAVIGDTLYEVIGTRAPRLVRTDLVAGTRRELALRTAGLPIHAIVGGFELSPDGRRISVGYRVTEELRAVATWELDTGALVWAGPFTAFVGGGWVIAGGRAHVPTFDDVDALLLDTGRRTNLRVCEADLRAVPVEPPPPPDTYWAPEAACAAAIRAR
jgi:hypothetical protein